MRQPSILVVPIIFSFILSATNLFYPTYDTIVQGLFPIIGGYSFDLYRALVLFGVFMTGAFHYRVLAGKPKYVMGVISIIFLCLAIGLYIIFGLKFSLLEHTRTRSLYYVLLAYAAIYLALALQYYVMAFLDKVKLASTLLLYCNKYSYAIFLSHTLVLYAVENVVGLDDLSDNPFLAIVRLLLVVSITLIISKPFGDFTKYLTIFIRSKLSSVKNY